MYQTELPWVYAVLAWVVGIDLAGLSVCLVVLSDDPIVIYLTKNYG